MAGDASAIADAGHVDFNRDVRPILAAACFSCHGMDEGARQAALRLDDQAVATAALPSGATAIVPADPGRSAVVARILSTDPDEVMPPLHAPRRLTDAEKTILRRWIAAGAVYEPLWSHVPPTRREPPGVRDVAWVRNPIDAFILGRLESVGLAPAPEADRRTLARRLFIDLTGLPPAPAEMEEFLADDAPDAYERFVDRLLASPRYGERQASLWLDLARYADSAGYEGDPEYPLAWRYRDYVIDAFNDDKPFDRFVLEQLAGDELEQVRGAGELPQPAPEGVVAVTFLRLAPFTEPRGEETRDLLLSEMTETVAGVFLAQTIGCAKCHDHKYDDIPSRDFYRLKAFFATVQIAPPERGDAFQIGGPQPAAFYRPGEEEWAAGMRDAATARLCDAEARRAEVEQELCRRIATARNEAEPVPAETLAEVAGKPDDPALTAEDRAAWDEACGMVAAAEMRLKRLVPAAMSLRHTFGPPYEPGAPTTHVLVRGDFERPGEAVRPGFPSSLTGDDGPAAIPLDPFRRWPTRGWRKALAEWIVSPDNPRTARVFVNRLWQRRFGRGIVATPSDFGALGSPPTHPELLDWLALRFVDDGWSMKRVDRLIVTSAAYRQSSRRVDPRAERVDPGNELLWRFRRRRLDAEAIRDGILAAGGSLDLAHVGGLAAFPPLPPELTAGPREHQKYRWLSGVPEDRNRRSLYVFRQRSLNLPLLDVFDGVVPDGSCPRREATVSPLQALALLNGELVGEEAARLAERIRGNTGADTEAQIDEAFRVVLCRPPDEAERRRLCEFLAADASSGDPLAFACRVLLNSNEFLHVD